MGFPAQVQTLQLTLSFFALGAREQWLLAPLLFFFSLMEEEEGTLVHQPPPSGFCGAMIFNFICLTTAALGPHGMQHWPPALDIDIKHGNTKVHVLMLEA